MLARSGCPPSQYWPILVSPFALVGLDRHARRAAFLLFRPFWPFSEGGIFIIFRHFGRFRRADTADSSQFWGAETADLGQFVAAETAHFGPFGGLRLIPKHRHPSLPLVQASLSTLAVDSAHGLAFVLASASQYPDLHDRLHGTLPLARALHCCAGPATPTAAAVATTVANLCATERHHGALLQPPLPRLLGDLVKDCGQDAEGQPVVLQVLRAVWNLVRSAATKQCPAFSSCVPLLEAIGALPHLSSEGLQLLLKVLGVPDVRPCVWGCGGTGCWRCGGVSSGEGQGWA